MARCQEKGQHLPSSPYLFPKLKSCSVPFYSSEEAGNPSTAEVVQPDSNSYRVFNAVDQSSSNVSLGSSIFSVNRTLKARLAPSIWPTNAEFYFQNPACWLELSPRRYAVRRIRPSFSFHSLSRTWHLDINRLVHPAQPLSSPAHSANFPDPRIFILSASPDASNSYIPS